MNAERVSQLFSSKIRRFTLLDKYLGPSLTNRVRSDNWFECRVIRYILKDSPWISDLEATFREAQLDAIPKSAEIFSALQGIELDYDEQLFDALAEVRLCKWARQNGFASIEKLATQSNRRTPELRMMKLGKVVLAEAKHFRVRDYLLYFAADRLEGLALKTGVMKIGLQVETGSKYAQLRSSMLANRKSWTNKTRAGLTEAAFSSLEQSLDRKRGSRIEILDGLFVVEQSSTASTGRVLPTLTGTLNPKAAVQQCLSKLERELLNKLRQIKEYMETAGVQADHSIVFFSGIDQWEPEWDVLWSTLDSNRERWVWNCVKSIQDETRSEVGMTFDLIVRRHKRQEPGSGGVIRYGPLEYSPFAWSWPGRMRP